MKTKLWGAVLAAAMVAGSAGATVIGSDATDRALFDSLDSIVLLYRGGTQPFAGNGDSAGVFTYFSDTRAGFWLTPILFEVTAADQYTVVAIGESHQTDASGVQSFDFATLAGSALTEAGKSYTFGFQNVAYAAGAAGGVEQVGGTANSGAIPFDGYNLQDDLWSYAFGGTLSVGQVYGSGGVGLDLQGFAGRIYSANLSFVPGAGTLAALGAGGLVASRRRR